MRFQSINRRSSQCNPQAQKKQVEKANLFNLPDYYYKERAIFTRKAI
jgi:hypothetical protein